MLCVLLVIIEWAHMVIITLLDDAIVRHIAWAILAAIACIAAPIRPHNLLYRLLSAAF